MKNIQFTILLCFLFLACYEEDVDVPLPSEERLILGNWEGVYGYLVFEDGSETPWDMNRCIDDIMNFYEDGRLWYFDLMRNPALENTCVENQKLKQDGSWKRISKGKYELIFIRESDNSEVIITPKLIVFEGSNSVGRTMTIHYETPPDNNPNEAISYSVTFKKK